MRCPNRVVGLSWRFLASGNGLLSHPVFRRVFFPHEVLKTLVKSASTPPNNPQGFYRSPTPSRPPKAYTKYYCCCNCGNVENPPLKGKSPPLEPGFYFSEEVPRTFGRMMQVPRG